VTLITSREWNGIAEIPGKSLPETPLFDGRTDHSLPAGGLSQKDPCNPNT
jgi:hypothetical protein